MKQRIVISRTDNLGDVILALPIAGFIKKHLPEAEVYFIGKEYTKPVIESGQLIDGFLDRNAILKDPQILKQLEADAIVFVFPDKELASLAKKLKIKTRIGTSHRIIHWWTCNKMVNFTRKKSDLHESQLNLKLLKPLQIPTTIALEEIADLYAMKAEPLPEKWQQLIPKYKFNLIMHPKSRGSAREWGIENYYQLIKILNPDKYHVFITGSAAEKELIHQEKPEIFTLPHVTDLTGQLSLTELISFIDGADGLLACSTGPLHIASALGKYALGVYPPIRPVHPGRWMPLGRKAGYLCLEKDCEDCRKTKKCACILSITAIQVKEIIEKWGK